MPPDEPLVSRTLRESKNRHFHTPPTAKPQARYGRYKLWTEEQMGKALEAVEERGIPLAQAAAEYSVPKSTLGDRVCSRVKPGAKSGPVNIEEKELSYFLLRCAAIGFPKTRKRVMAIVQRVLDSKGVVHTLTDGWWTSFSRRHPELSLRNPAPLSKARAMASNSETINAYFDLLEETLDAYNLRDHPELVFNMDESGMPLNPNAPKVVAGKSKCVTAMSSGDKTQITIAGCVSASGYCMPPLVIWDRKTLNLALTQGEVRGTRYALSESGWMTADIFDGWFCSHFLRHAQRDRPLLLLLDGHSSHFCPETLSMAAKNEVVVFVLPPNTTHLSQPLDKGCFGPLKTAWREVCHRFMTDNPGKVVTRYTFSKLFADAWMNSMTMRNGQAGFSTTGIYPVKREVLLAKVNEKEKENDSQCLPFLSMSTPLPKRVRFTIEEELLFQRRFENGYDTTTDKIYNEWVLLNHPAQLSNQTQQVTSQQSPSLQLTSWPHRLCK